MIVAWVEQGGSIAAGLVAIAARVALQVAVIVAVAGLLERLMARRSAAARNGVWLAALLLCATAPLIAIAAGRAGFELVTLRPPAAPGRVRVQADDRPAPAAVPMPGRTASVVRPARRPTLARTQQAAIATPEPTDERAAAPLAQVASRPEPSAPAAAVSVVEAPPPPPAIPLGRIFGVGALLAWAIGAAILGAGWSSAWRG